MSEDRQGTDAEPIGVSAGLPVAFGGRLSLAGASRLGVLAAGLLVAVGCKTVRPELPSITFSRRASPPQETERGYVVGAGDELRVAFRDGRWRRETVAPDGTIAAGRAERIAVDGMTPPEIERLLAETTGQEPRVDAVGFESRVVHVHDAKGKRRALPFRGRESIESLLDRVGCPVCRLGYRVRVVRPSERLGDEPRVYAFEFDAGGDRTGGDPGFRVDAGDYVYVEQDSLWRGPLTRMTESRLYRKGEDWLRRFRVATAADEARPMLAEAEPPRRDDPPTDAVSPGELRLAVGPGYESPSTSSIE